MTDRRIEMIDYKKANDDTVLLFLLTVFVFLWLTGGLCLSRCVEAIYQDDKVFDISFVKSFSLDRSETSHRLQVDCTSQRGVTHQFLHQELTIPVQRGWGGDKEKLDQILSPYHCEATFYEARRVHDFDRMSRNPRRM